MNSLTVGVFSLLETAALYFLLAAIDDRNRLTPVRVAAFTGMTAVMVVITDLFQIPLHTIVLIGVMLCLLKCLSGNHFLDLFADLILAYAAEFIFQLAIMAAFCPFGVDITQNRGLLIGALLIQIGIGAAAARSIRIDRFFMKYYRGNRKAAALTFINLMLMFAIITNLWDDENKVFWSNHRTMLILAGAYFILNGILLVLMFLNTKHAKQLRVKAEHEEYLQELTEQLSRREHEYKNHLNAIIGIALYRKEDPLKAIVQYAQLLLSEEQERQRVSIISENSNISAFINHKIQEGKKDGINLECYIERPFPEYEIEDTALIELLSNLLNNAFEAVMAFPEDVRFVSLSIESEQILIANYVGNSLGEGDLYKYKEDGASSKGRGRGYGLGNILQICRRHHIGINTFIKDNYIVFQLNI